MIVKMRRFAIAILTAGMLLFFACSGELPYTESDTVTETFSGIYLSDSPKLYIDRRGNPANGTFESDGKNGVLKAELTFLDGMIASGEIHRDNDVVLRYYSENGLFGTKVIMPDGGVYMESTYGESYDNRITFNVWFEDGSPFIQTVPTMHKRWHENGELASKTPLIEGRANGKGLAWHENGELAAENHFKDDQWHGTFRAWDEEGNLLSERFYDMGMPYGVHKFWDSSGNLIEEKSYEDGKPHGSHKKWDNEGNLVSTRVFEMGEVVSGNL
jgi:antitoxin component YwqK of YwqJK toxin-antitoxin module